MKKFIFILLAYYSVGALFAQSPNQIQYQAIIRNASGAVVANQAVGMRVSVLKTSASGTVVYSETHRDTSTANGLVTVEIGLGTVVSGSFASINWGQGPYFIKTETDITGGTNYQMIGTTQLLSVPYALYANNGIKNISITGDTLYLGDSTKFFIPGISINNNRQFHSCNIDNIHNPKLSYQSVVDIDGNYYKAVKIGNQTWFSENLKTTRYQNGDTIQNITDAAKWNQVQYGAWSYYNNDINYNCPYGKLYNGYAAIDTRNICPSGWHVPTDGEWNILIKTLDPIADTTCTYCYQSTIAGSKLKSATKIYWDNNNISNNESGFSAIGGGMRSDGVFGYIRSNGYYWSKTKNNPNNSWDHYMYSGSANVTRDPYGNLNEGFSIRCIKD
jgi:uncharacterized protein (TIGR02145 family)